MTAPEANVLIVDDIDTNLEVAEGFMQPYGMQITLCKSGMEAIEKMKSKRYDLVFMDHMMPEMDGVETVAKIRALSDGDSYCKNVPIVALTADAIMGAREMILKNDFNDFMPKPIDPVMLNAILEKWIPKEKQKKTAEGARQTAAAEEPQTNKKIEIDGLDTKKGIAMTGGKTERYLKTLALFYKNGLEKIREIKKCLETGDIPTYTIYVHALKSSAAIIGTDTLSEAAKALEMAGKQEDLAFIRANNDAFIMDMEALLGNINAFLSEAAEEARKNPVNKDLLKAELSRLKTALNDFEYNEINNAVNSLQEFTQAAEVGDSVSSILQSKLIGEYDEAAALIDSLLQKLNDGT